MSRVPGPIGDAEAYAPNRAPREFLFALVNPVPGKDAEFETWYWNTHIPEVLELPGFHSAQRYRSAAPSGSTVSHRYSTVYEIEGSAAAALETLYAAGLGSSEDLDTSSIVFAAFTAEGDPITG